MAALSYERHFTGTSRRGDKYATTLPWIQIDNSGAVHKLILGGDYRRAVRIEPRLAREIAQYRRCNQPAMHLADPCKY